MVSGSGVVYDVSNLEFLLPVGPAFLKLGSCDAGRRTGSSCCSTHCRVVRRCNVMFSPGKQAAHHKRERCAGRENGNGQRGTNDNEEPNDDQASHEAREVAITTVQCEASGDVTDVRQSQAGVSVARNQFAMVDDDWTSGWGLAKYVVLSGNGSERVLL
eukprot:6477795-Amphidinium_carterae.1